VSIVNDSCRALSMCVKVHHAEEEERSSGTTWPKGRKGHGEKPHYRTAGSAGSKGRTSPLGKSKEGTRNLVTRSINSFPRKSGSKITLNRPRPIGRDWKEWFDRFWEMASSGLVRATLGWGCDIFNICYHLYLYSSIEPTEVEVFKAEIGEVGKRAYALASIFLEVAAEVDKLHRTITVLGLDSDAVEIEKLSSNLWGGTAILAKLCPLKRYASRRNLGKNYHLVIVDEHVRFVAGSYHRTEVSYWAWAARAAHADDPESIEGISADAVAKASRDLQRKNPQFFASVRRIAQEYPRWDLIGPLVDSASSKLFGAPQ
jgi:hypothetical protein